jgi:hypothetical protein
MRAAFFLLRLLKKELGLGMEARSYIPAPMPKSTKPEKKQRKQKRDRTKDSESEDEVSTFQARPTAKTNQPMIIPLVEKTRKQAIELSMAQ